MTKIRLVKDLNKDGTFAYIIQIKHWFVWWDEFRSIDKAKAESVFKNLLRSKKI